MVDGYQRPAAAGDSDAACSCSERTPETTAAVALTAIISYHSVRSDMNAMAQFVEMLRGSNDEQRPWLRYIVSSSSTSAWVAFSRGDRESARRHLAEWEAMLTGDGEQFFAHTIEFVGLDGFIDLASLRMLDFVLTGDSWTPMPWSARRNAGSSKSVLGPSSDEHLPIRFA